MAEEGLDSCHRDKKTEGKESMGEKGVYNQSGNKTLKEMLKLKRQNRKNSELSL
jgi:hypothetical protein